MVITLMEVAKKMFKNNFKYLIILSISLFFLFVFNQVSAVSYGSGVYGGSLYSAALSGISDILVEPNSNGAQISFNTSELTSVSINYGLTSSYGTSTIEIDLSPLALSHRVELSNLRPCTTYHYNIIVKDAYLNQVTSSDRVFTTTGCIASSAISDNNTSQIDKAIGGTLILKDSSLNGLTLTIPANFATSSANFQIHKLSRDTVLNFILTPRDFVAAGDYVYELKALTGLSDLISVFDRPLVISIAYNANDILEIDESSLKIYRWDDGVWTQLNNCSVDMSAKTVTCETSHFSVFSLFGQQISSVNPVNSSLLINTPCSSVAYDVWQETCVNGRQFRNILNQTPNFCSLTTEQRSLTERACGEALILENSLVNKIANVYNYERSVLAQVIDKKLSTRLAGYILLQVEAKGQAWYLDPKSLSRYYLADGPSAYQALRQFGLGITNKDLDKIPVAPASALPDSYNKSTNYSEVLVNKLKGRILLQVENRGEAWYVNPRDGYRYYLANGEAAYQIMKQLSLGINNENIRKIGVGDFK
jgi:hypothetical protein